MSKLTQFVEAALTNPRHPAYAVGLRHSAALQHYAINVHLLRTMTPEVWEADYPKINPTAYQRVQQALAMLEAEAAGQPAADSDVDALRAKVAELEAKLAALVPAPAATPAAEPPPQA